MKSFFKRMFDDNNEDDHVCGMTDVGRRRENNEDCFAIYNERNIFIVSDGMGGHNAGEVASAEAVKALGCYFSDELVKRMKSERASVQGHMQSAFIKVNDKICMLSKEKRDYDGMGCALIMAFIDDNILHTCHVGDVRCYVCNQSAIFQLTNDHTQVGELVQAGKLTLEEARKSSFKHILTQAIGAVKSITPEYHSHRLQENDRVLLCSDGLWDMLSDDEIRMTVLTNQEPTEICKELIGQANIAGGNDNITVVVFVNNR